MINLKNRYYLLIGCIFFLAYSETSAYGAMAPDTNGDQFDKSEWENITDKSDYAEKSRENVSREFDKDEWKEITSNKDYTESIKDKKPKKKSKADQEKKEPRKYFWNKTLSGGFMSVLKVLLYMVIIGVLAFLIFIILKNGFGYFNEKVPTRNLSSLVQNLEENLDNADFEDLLDKAIREGEYRLAVRIFYLRVIKLLSDRELIRWKREKTNGHYVLEMSDKSGGKDFALLTSIYEHVWFGDFRIDQGKFEIISMHFTKFQEDIH